MSVKFGSWMCEKYDRWGNAQSTVYYFDIVKLGQIKSRPSRLFGAFILLIFQRANKFASYWSFYRVIAIGFISKYIIVYLMVVWCQRKHFLWMLSIEHSKSPIIWD